LKKGRSRLRFTKTKHLLCKGQINNKKGTFLIDTGASFCCVNQQKMEYFGIQENGHSIEALMVNGENLRVTLTSKCELKLGRFKMGKHQLIFIDMSIINQKISESKSTPIDVIIGGAFLEQINAQIDYGTMTLHFHYSPKA